MLHIDKSIFVLFNSAIPFLFFYFSDLIISVYIFFHPKTYFSIFLYTCVCDVLQLEWSCVYDEGLWPI